MEDGPPCLKLSTQDVADSRAKGAAIVASMQSRAVRAQQASSSAARFTIADLVLIRVATGGATRAELQRDLAPLVAPRVPGTAFRQSAELAIGNHTAQQLLSETKGRLSATPAGLKTANALVPVCRLSNVGWEVVRNTALILEAIVIASKTPALGKAVERAEGLAALMLQKHYGLPAVKALSPTDLRAELAVIALEKAFGNKIKTGLAKGSGLPAKTGRLLAGQLFSKPRDVASDGKLLSLLAAELYGAPADTLDGLRLALLRRLTDDAGPAGDQEKSPAAEMPRQRRSGPLPANDLAPLEAGKPAVSKGPAAPPDMLEFSGAVLDAARPVSEGWSGNRKAFISLVWRAIRNARPEWELTEIAFKSMLAEAHRSGTLVLASADLKDKRSLQEIEDSKILYKNTVWHFVRVED